MKIKIYFFGKKNEITEREKELIKRIGFRSSIELVTLPQAGVSDSQKTKEKEASFLNKKCIQGYRIALDEHGDDMDSIAFSTYLKNKLIERGIVHFFIGGSYGLDESILSQANKKIRFGKMVWTRNLCRLMALEQIYRALEIDGGGNFHK
jgi:23S rRNA (pseudouridine1915-N3)-methyltransferase